MALDSDSEETIFRFDVYSGGDDFPSSGQLIDTVYADRFRGSFADLEELYTAARRNALGLDKVIAE
ncbi:hypothetical protein SAMN04488020_11718 [Palleronia marisminoris]|uniref:Uncharacterized protein n=1 Tax=Palleronia marisminoris TaxID=315423 RepID=A0A1Y5TQ66_9RHOB|nr:hypothetical protein [Palleronia marisminoris]SFH48790.1 hypothetical protein SAMN04488020_11718 [Palleronia marisminoris]SLN69530.1 hypothetical protein PAM7066_03520 [Palleronia marisminoris]